MEVKNNAEIEKTMFNFFKTDSDNKPKALVAVVKDSQVIIKTTTGGSLRAIGYGMSGTVLNCQISPDFKHVVATTDKGVVCISDPMQGGTKRTFGTTTFGQPNGKAVSASWIDNETLLVNTDKGHTFSLKIKTGSTRKLV